MGSLYEKLTNEFKDKELNVIDVKGSNISGKLEDIGQDYIVIIQEGGRKTICNLMQVVTIREVNIEFTKKQANIGDR